jgi:putative ABC transport system permease protein
MGIPLLAGRDISASDVPGSPYVIVVSRSVAQSLFPGTDPIGELVNVGDWRELEIVGVAEDARINTLRGEPDAAMYMASAQMGSDRMQIAVRTAIEPTLLLRPIEDLLRQKDPNVLFARPRTMSAVVDENLAGFRAVILALALFAAVALLLATVGIYGILAYHVTQRRAELGLRLAIGASEGDLARMILRRGMALVAIGLVLGLGLAYPGTLAVRQLLFQIPLLDPTAYLGAVLSLAVVAALACYLPARRASRSDIVDVLRTE